MITLGITLNGNAVLRPYFHDDSEPECGMWMWAIGWLFFDLEISYCAPRTSC